MSMMSLIAGSVFLVLTCLGVAAFMVIPQPQTPGRRILHIFVSGALIYLIAFLNLVVLTSIGCFDSFFEIFA
jgi:hypothetical protein